MELVEDTLCVDTLTTRVNNTLQWVKAFASIGMWILKSGNRAAEVACLKQVGPAGAYIVDLYVRA